MALVLRKAWLLDYYTTALPAPDQAGSRNESSVKALQLVRVRSLRRSEPNTLSSLLSCLRSTSSPLRSQRSCPTLIIV